mmetsp:Transcript_27793/g.24590  ORF Transcript_27793/g.24590 Transcript_27793/m.24590 type:complete len:162 (-) Transcript_27793:37-522(-)
MYYKKIKQGMNHVKNVRKSSVVNKKEEGLTVREETKALSQRRSYDGSNKVKRLQSDTSSVTSRGKENINVNIRHSHDNYTHKLEHEDKIKALMKQRESLIKERKKLRLVLDKFEKEFILNNGRKIKYMNDVKAVSNEYSHYKSLKIVIQELEGKIKFLIKG